MTSSPTFAITPQTLFAGIVTARLAASCEFYCEHFEFRVIGADADTTLLARTDGAQLGLLRAGQSSYPAALQSATRGTGVWLNLEVDDPDALFARLNLARVEVVAPPEFSASATRRFIVRDPNGILVYVTERAAAGRPPVLAQQNTDTLSHDQGHCHSLHGLSCH